MSNEQAWISEKEPYVVSFVEPTEGGFTKYIHSDVYDGMVEAAGDDIEALRKELRAMAIKASEYLLGLEQLQGMSHHSTCGYPDKDCGCYKAVVLDTLNPLRG